MNIRNTYGYSGTYQSCVSDCKCVFLIYALNGTIIKPWSNTSLHFLYIFVIWKVLESGMCLSNQHLLNLFFVFINAMCWLLSLLCVYSLFLVLILRCLQWTTFVERTFCVDTEAERAEWMDAIQKVSDNILQQDNQNAKSELAATGSTGTVNGAQDPKSNKVCLCVCRVCACLHFCMCLCCLCVCLSVCMCNCSIV